MPILELAIVGFLILLNGFFAMSELALVSSRRGRLQQLAQNGNRGARIAMRLTDDPTGFLSTVQVGITLVGIFAGAYSGATLASPLADILRKLPFLGTSADTVAFVLVVITIAYLSLIAGELVPKRLALNNAEGIAASVAGPMALVAKFGAPIVWFLRLSTETVLRVLRVKAKPDSTVTEEEVKSMIAEGTDAGIFEQAEKEMIEGVLRLADRPVRSIMIPRPDVDWLDAQGQVDALHRQIVETGHSRYPVGRGSVDNIIGVVQAKDLLDQQRRTGTIDLESAVRAPLYIDERLPVLKLLDRFRSSNVHMAVIVDEHGSFQGVVTPTDILIAIAGDLPERAGDEVPDAVKRKDGSWLLDGAMAIDDVERKLGVSGLRQEEDYSTLAGFALRQLGRIPEAGAVFTWRDWRFEIVDLDGRRIDKILAARIEIME